MTTQQTSTIHTQIRTLATAVKLMVSVYSALILVLAILVSLPVYHLYVDLMQTQITSLGRDSTPDMLKLIATTYGTYLVGGLIFFYIENQRALQLLNNHIDGTQFIAEQEKYSRWFALSKSLAPEQGSTLQSIAGALLKEPNPSLWSSIKITKQLLKQPELDPVTNTLPNNIWASLEALRTILKASSLLGGSDAKKAENEVALFAQRLGTLSRAINYPKHLTLCFFAWLALLAVSV